MPRHACAAFSSDDAYACFFRFQLFMDDSERTQRTAYD